jgi:hypothetical protein
VGAFAAGSVALAEADRDDLILRNGCAARGCGRVKVILAARIVTSYLARWKVTAPPGKGCDVQPP